MNIHKRGTFRRIAEMALAASVPLAFCFAQASAPLTEQPDTNFLKLRQQHAYTPDEYQAALADSGMLAAKQAEWQGSPLRAGVWQSLGPIGTSTAGNGRASNLTVRSVAGGFEVTLGASSGGVWRRVSTGTSWAYLSLTLPNQHIGGIWVDPANGNNMAVGTGNKRENGSGFYWTSDGGATWTLATLLFGTPTPSRIYKIVFNPGTPNTMAAATNAGMYRSVDAGHTWTRQQAGTFEDVAVDGGNATNLYACRMDSPAGIYKSTDFGATWPTRFSNATDSDIPADGQFDVGATASCRGVADAVAFVAGNTGAGTIQTVVRSVDGGTSWTNVTGNIPTGQSEIFHSRAIAFRPNNANELYVGVVDLFRTTNANAASPSWAGIIGGHPDVTELSFHASAGDTALWICNDGGVYRYNVGGSTDNWNGDAVNGLRISEGYGLDAEAAMVVGGLQDNNLVRTTDGGSTWTQHSCCDGMRAEITDNIGNDAYVAWASPPGCCANIDHLYPDGHTQNLLVPGDAAGGMFWFDRLGNRIYCQSWNGTTNTVLSTGVPATPGVFATEFVEPIDVLGFYGSYLDRALFATSWSLPRVAVAQLGGGSWSVQTRSVGGAGNSFVVYPSLERIGESWLGLWSDPGQPKLRHTTDFWSTVNLDVSSTLASLRAINGIVVMPFNQDEMYVATDVGVFQSLDGGASWAPFQTGLPIIGCEDLKLIKRTTGTDTLVVMTWGLGVWKRDIPGTPLVYVDDRTSGVEDGTIEHPYHTFGGAAAAVPAGGTVALHGARYHVAPITITHAMTLTAYESDAVLGN
ncbi:MAG: hypothetical protein U1D55_05480 [Phycisphaerae bacterium]